ncbi:hypothetical protein AGDE_06798 [Angomonas deanei]|nr:hypothetical protein AGDE_06798 [Angomonas deanei]|eukprot:EPY36676.1 hypothetical protein AGDE_06798 [Angomonas deanei]
MRRVSLLLCSAIQNIPETVKIKKDYQKIEAKKKELAEIEAKKREFENFPLRYQVLECRPGLPLALTKLKYLLACRRTHPEAGGDPEDFLRVSLAYQDVMKDYGVETVDNKIVNLGNFQVDDHEAQNYLTERAKIQSYIPISTLEDHIHQIEEIKERLGDRLSELLSSGSDEAVWLLEDIEEKMEESGLKTVKLQVLEDGKVKVADNLSLTDGTEKPLFLSADPDEATKAEGERFLGEKSNVEEEEEQGEEHAGKPKGDAEKNEEEHPKGAVIEAAVNAEDIEVLNAKHNLQERSDVAGLASRTATEVMNNTEEKKQAKIEGSVLLLLVSLFCCNRYLYIERQGEAKRQKESNRRRLST